jgi:membrane carboxypeptidase/penicillin-binding protein PbpC
MVGSADFFDDSIEGQVNVAISRRQAGSTLKPFIYLAGFSKGYTPASILQDVATSFSGNYRPQNHDKKFRGPVSVRQALATSLNVPAVKMLEAVGLEEALTTVHRMGITDLTDERRYGLALALGAGEVKLLDLVYAYTPFANGGRQVGEPVPAAQRERGFREFAPVAVMRITDGNGQPIYEYRAPEGRQVADPELAYLITSILSDDEARAGTYGRHSFLELSRPAAAKTGTTDDYRDGWTVGYTPELATGVWVGNADNTPMLDVYGVSGAGHIWHNFMERALKNRTASDFPRPPGIKEVMICADTGLPATAGCQKTVTELLASKMMNFAHEGGN